MSNYVKSTNFASKDTLPSGDSNKIVKGTEIDTEFNNISTAISTKADLSGPTFTGSPVLPTGTTGVTQSSSDDSTKLATTAFVQDVADVVQAAVKQALYPVGSIYCNATSSTNPATLLGFGTWTAFGSGRVMVGDGGGFTAGNTGGSADAVVVSHTHSVSDPGHTHTTVTRSAADGSSGSYTYMAGVAGSNAGTDTSQSSSIQSASTGISVSSTGTSGTNANLQPYIVVYMWKRTA